MQRALLSFLLLSTNAFAASVTGTGGVPNDGGDDREAFDAAIVLAGLDGTKTVEVPCGTFNISRTPGAGSPSLGGVNIDGINTLNIQGRGRCTVIKVMWASDPSVGNFFLFNVQDSSHVKFEALTLDGNSAAVSGANEQTHLVRTLNAHGLEFRDVIFQNSWGDGVKMTSTSDTSDVRFEHVTFTSMKRNGITFHNGITDVHVVDATFRDFADQAIDFEPGSRGPQRVVLDRLSVYDEGKDDLTVALSGGNTMPGDATRFVVLTNSYVEGEINLVRAGPTTISNTAVVSAATCLSASRYMDSLTLIGNTFDCDKDNRGSGVAGGSGLALAQVGDIEQGPQRTLIMGNHIVIGDSDSPRFGIDFGGGCGYGRTIIVGNDIRSKQTPSSLGGGVAVSCKTTVAGQTTRGLSLHDNTIEGFAVGLRLVSAPGLIRDAYVAGNTFLDTPGLPGVAVTCNNTALGAAPSVKIGPNIFGALGAQSGYCELIP